MSKIRGWVYYVPKLETLCIVRPDYVDEDGRTPTEWGNEYLPKAILIDARENSETRNAIYVGNLEEQEK